MTIIIILEIYFWLLLEAGMVNKNLAVKPGSSRLKPQFTSNMTFSRPLVHTSLLFSQLLTKGDV